MCRYAMSLYKPHYACFECRKTFKRRLLRDINRDDKRQFEAKCPQCGGLMANMGLDFESPKKDDIRAWEHIKLLYSVDITFHSCGCSGPGYIPRSPEMLVKHFEAILKEYNRNLAFWRQRVEPANSREVDREISKHWNDYLRHVPYELRNKKLGITNEEAKNYWIGQIKEVEGKIERAKRNV